MAQAAGGSKKKQEVRKLKSAKKKSGMHEVFHKLIAILFKNTTKKKLICMGF